VHPIGQMIDVTFLPPNPAMPSIARKKWFHVGRLDPSKRIEEIIDSMEYCRGQGFDLSLDIFGEPSSNKHYQYAQALRDRYSNSNYSEWIKFKGRIARSDYAAVVNNYDGFIHAFEGSLDKTLVEAVLSKKIVVSLNQEFRESFQTQCEASTTSASLAQALLEVLKAPYLEIESEIEKNYSIALQSHTFEVWIKRVREILEEK
jgi:glycosyltransferase involved in cell wall biosynthesis